ncbi:hypothetical protein ACFLR7_03225 [Acidobacteriota bacterium]
MSKKLVGPILTLLVLGIVPLGVAEPTQEFSLEAKFSLKEIRHQGFVDFQGIMAFLPVSSDVNIAFARDGKYEPGEAPIGAPPWDLKSFSFSNKGKFQLLNHIADASIGWIWDVDAVWLGDHAYAATLTDGPSGLVFVLFWDYDYYTFYNRGGTITLRVARFDENGTLISGWTDLFTFDAHPDWGDYSREDYSSGLHVKVAVGNNQIGIALGLPFYSIGRLRSRAFFLRTDFHGNPIKKAVKLKLQNHGEKQRTLVFHPLWNGTRWLVPAATDFSYPEEARKVFIFASTDGQAKKFRRKMITSRQQLRLDFRNLSVVLSPSSSGQKGNSLLFVQEEISDFVKYTLENPNKYFIFPLNKQGNRASGAIEVLIPRMEYSFQYDPMYPNARHYDHFSNMIISYSPPSASDNSQDNDSGLYIAHMHHLYNSAPQGGGLYRNEQQLHLYKIYPEDGSVAHLGKIVDVGKAKLWPWLTPPLIAKSGKKILVITNGRFDRPGLRPSGYTSYFSKAKY